MVKIDPVLLLLQLATFLVAVFLLWRLLWKPLVRMMEQRQKGIEDDIAAAKRNRAAAEELEAAYRRRLAEIDKEAAALMQRATDEGRRSRDEVLRDAQAEARRLLENATRQISEEKARAIRELRSETVALAVLIAEKALKQSVDPGVQQRLVDEFVKELKNG